MTNATNPTNEQTADAEKAGEDTALAAAAAAAGGAETTDTAAEGADKVEGGDKATGDAKGADGAKEGEKAAGEVQGAPESYDITAFKMPEVDGKQVEFDAEGFELVAPVLKDLNLSQEQAGTLVAAYAEKVVPLIEKRTLDAVDNQGAEIRANLARELQADPEVGGKALEESRSHAAKAIAHYIPNAEERSQFSTFLNESGFGNHPLLMRIVAGAGKAISEATTAAGRDSGKPTSEAEKFYGAQGKG